MASRKLPWETLWPVVWRLIPSPATEGRILLAGDDSVNPKTGKEIFGCHYFFDHAAKQNQSDYAWAQNIVQLGLLKLVHAVDRVLLLKTIKIPVRVVWVYYRTKWVALFTTDLTLTVEQIITYYGARWKIESGFKELKQEIGSQQTQTRVEPSVTNHLNFCMMAVTITWIYCSRLSQAPIRRHIVWSK